MVSKKLTFFGQSTQEARKQIGCRVCVRHGTNPLDFGMDSNLSDGKHDSGKQRIHFPRAGRTNLQLRRARAKNLVGWIWVRLEMGICNPNGVAPQEGRGFDV